jgi:hypothetical protein
VVGLQPVVPGSAGVTKRKVRPSTGPRAWGRLLRPKSARWSTLLNGSVLRDHQIGAHEPINPWPRQTEQTKFGLTDLAHRLTDLAGLTGLAGKKNPLKSSSTA